VYAEIQTKRLAQKILLFTACSACVILLCAVATSRHNTLAQRSLNIPVFTYQNPFRLAESTSTTAASPAKAGGLLNQLFSVKWALRLTGLGTLWLASTWYLTRGLTPKKHIHRKVKYAIGEATEKMNPLAILPNPINPVAKQDNSRPAVLCQTNTRCLVMHRKVTAPCQSRFRPVTLVSRQTRLGHL
jgi:hypothetical protein